MDSLRKTWSNLLLIGNQLTNQHTFILRIVCNYLFERETAGPVHFSGYLDQASQLTSVPYLLLPRLEHKLSVGARIKDRVDSCVAETTIYTICDIVLKLIIITFIIITNRIVSILNEMSVNAM